MRKPRRLTNEQLAPWVWEAKNLSPQPPPLRREGEKNQYNSKTPTARECLAPPPFSGEGVGGRGSSPSPIDWNALFGNTHPVEIEVGMGKGLFLLNAATARPGTNFLGIEIVRKYQLYAATRYAIRDLTNIKTACADAKVILRDFVAPASVAAVHVYFPDPWWKKRHKKRRVFTAEFAALAARSVVAGGRLYLASDVEEYFGVMTGIVNAMPAFELRPDEEHLSAPRTEAGFATNFERKALETGGSVWRAVYARTGQPAPEVTEEPEDGTE